MKFIDAVHSSDVYRMRKYLKISHFHGVIIFSPFQRWIILLLLEDLRTLWENFTSFEKKS